VFENHVENVTRPPGETPCIAFETACSIVFILLIIEHGALLPSAVVSFYCVFLLYSALRSDPSDCNPSRSAKGSVEEWIGLILTCLSLCVGAFRLSENIAEEFDEVMSVCVCVFVHNRHDSHTYTHTHTHINTDHAHVHTKQRMRAKTPQTHSHICVPCVRTCVCESVRVCLCMC